MNNARAWEAPRQDQGSDLPNTCSNDCDSANWILELIMFSSRIIMVNKWHLSQVTSKYWRNSQESEACELHCGGKSKRDVLRERVWGCCPFIVQERPPERWPRSQAPGSSYRGLYDFSGFKSLKIAIFLSVLSGFEVHWKKFCDILVQLGGFEDKFGKNFAS